MSNSPGSDGAIGFSASAPFDYNNSDGVSAGQYDFFGVVAHEVSEIMGRQLLIGETIGNSPNGYAPMDLLHYTSPGVHTFTGTQAGYFSADNGITNLGSFNTNPDGDSGDWAASAGADAFLAFSNAGKALPVTANDLKVMDAIGWNLSSSSSDTTPPQIEENTTLPHDFNNNGKSDFLIENTSGAVQVGEVANGQVGYTQMGRRWGPNGNSRGLAIFSATATRDS